MTFDLQYLKACGFKVFNFVEDGESGVAQRSERSGRRRARAVQGRGRASVAKDGGAARQA